MTIQEDSTKHYPGFRGGAKRPTYEFRYIKVPGGHKHIKDEPGLSTFVKTRYTISFTYYGKKKKQVVWAKSQEEAFAMIRDLYPGIKGELKKNPRGAGIPIDQTQLELMMYALKQKIAYTDSKKEKDSMIRLVISGLMFPADKNGDIYNLTSRGKKLLLEYLKEQEKYA